MSRRRKRRGTKNDGDARLLASIAIVLFFGAFIFILLYSIDILFLGISNLISKIIHDMKLLFSEYRSSVLKAIGGFILCVIAYGVIKDLIKSRKVKVFTDAVHSIGDDGKMLFNRQNKRVRNLTERWDEQIIRGSKAIAKARLVGKPIGIVELSAEMPLTIEADTDMKFRRFRDRQFCFHVASQNLPKPLFEAMGKAEKNDELYGKYLEKVCKIWDQYGGQCDVTDVPLEYRSKRERALFEEACIAAPVTDVMVRVRVVHTKAELCDPIEYSFMLSLLVQCKKDAEAHEIQLAQYAGAVDAAKGEIGRVMSDLDEVKAEYEAVVCRSQLAEEQTGKAIEEYNSIKAEGAALAEAHQRDAEALEQEIRQRSSALAGLNRRIGDVNALVSEKDASMHLLAEQLKLYGQSLEQKKQEIDMAEQSIALKREENRKLCECCQQMKETVMALEGEIRNREKKVANLDHQLDDLMFELAKYQDLVSDVEARKVEIKQLKSIAEDLQQRIKEYEKALSSDELIAFRMRRVVWPDWANNRKTIMLNSDRIDELSAEYRKDGVAAEGDVSGCYVLMNLDMKYKPYVGQAKNVFRRWKEHINGKGSDGVYGDLKRGCIFSATVIPIAGTRFMSLDNMEGVLISYFKADKRGYNKTSGNGMRK